jgi:hypothetical protein
VLTAHAAFASSYYAYGWQHLTVDLSPLSLTAAQNLLVGTGGLTLLIAAVYAALIVSFRRHKIDDYRGRYRVWYYVTGAQVALGLARLSGLDATARSLSLLVFQRLGVDTPSRWPPVLLAVLELAVAGRLVYEVWPCRKAAVLLLASAGSLLASVAWQLERLSLTGPELHAVALGLSQLASYQLLLLAEVFYARHVVFDAQGLLATPARLTRRRILRPRKSRSAAGAHAVRVVEDTSSPPPLAAHETPVPRNTAPTASSDRRSTDADAPSSRPAPAKATTTDKPGSEREAPTTVAISRSERKRLRKEQRRSRHAA